MKFHSSFSENKKQPAQIFFWLIIILLVILIILTNGISLVPPQQYQRLSQNPFATRTDIASDNYWQETILLPLAAFYAGWNDPLTFNALCFFIIIAAYLFFAQSSYHKFGFAHALIFTALLIASPVSTVLFSWLGTPDGLTFFLTIPLLFTNSVAFIFILSTLGVANHIVFMIAGFEILVLRFIARASIKPVHILAQIMGGATGYLLIQLFLSLNHIHVLSRLDYILSKDLTIWTTINSMNFPLTIFSFFNVQWFFIPICSARLFKKDKYSFLTMWAFLFLNYGITFFTLDQTRIFSLLSWAILLQCLFHSYFLSSQNADNHTFSKRMFFQFSAIIGVLSFIAPRYYSWEGYVYLAPFWDHLIRIFR